MAITKEQATKDGIMSGCPLIEGRNKLDFDSMVGEVLTVEDYAVAKTKDGDAFAIIFKEYPELYAWAGGFLQNCINNYGKDFIGTRIKVEKKIITNNGRTYRPFDIV